MTTMPRSKVFIHIGPPKTGTTYLQHFISQQRAELKDQGLLYPGEANDHFLPALDAMEHDFRGYHDNRTEGTWKELLDEVGNWSGNVLISHEVLAGAKPKQIKAIVAAFPGRDVQLVMTGRDLARQFTASWQERVKNGRTYTLAEYIDKARTEFNDAETTAGFWGSQNLTHQMQKWRSVLEADQMHLVTVPPPGSDRNLLLTRFAEVLGVTLSAEQTSGPQNVSLGYSQVEFLRRLNEQVFESVEWPQYRRYVKQLLVRRVFRRNDEPDPIRCSPTDQAWVSEVSKTMVAQLKDADFQLHGDLVDLVSSPAGGVEPEVDEAVILEMGIRSVATLLRQIAREDTDEPKVAREHKEVEQS